MAAHLAGAQALKLQIGTFAAGQLAGALAQVHGPHPLGLENLGTRGTRDEPRGCMGEALCLADRKRRRHPATGEAERMELDRQAGVWRQEWGEKSFLATFASARASFLLLPTPLCAGPAAGSIERVASCSSWLAAAAQFRHKNRGSGPNRPVSSSARALGETLWLVEGSDQHGSTDRRARARSARNRSRAG